MVQRQTEAYRRSFSGSMGAGVSALMSGSHRQYYVLEFRTSSKYHHAGETQKIIVDQVEIGRDSRCQIRFDDSFTSVSRHHAAIVKDGNGWKLIHLSKVNSTLLNGRPVLDQWYLQNGDEIQLSSNGPRIGFIMPQGDKSMIKNINFTERFSLFRQQALRPYQRMLSGVIAMFVVLVGCLVGWNMLQENRYQKDNLRLTDDISRVKALQDSSNVETQKQLSDVNGEILASASKTQAVLQTSFSNYGASNHKAIGQIAGEVGSLRSRMEEQDKRQKVETETKAAEVQDKTVVKENKSKMISYDSCFPSIYYIQLDKVEHYDSKGKVHLFPTIRRWAGTGFLLSDGRFISSRKIIERWYYQENMVLLDRTLEPLNKAVCKQERVVAYFTAYASNGDALTFTNEQFTYDRSGDSYIKNGKMRIAPSKGGKDWAYFQTSKHGGLKYNFTKASTMDRGVSLTILGFPGEIGINSASGPVLGSGMTASRGLDRGDIMTTSTNFELAGSGAPVFATSSDGDLEVIGLVSSIIEGQRGVIVPISAVR